MHFFMEMGRFGLFLNNDTANLCIYNEPVGVIKPAHI